MVVGRGNDAIPTWSGFNYQGKMMLLYVLELINQIAKDKNKDIDAYSVELEKTEDFCIICDSEYKSFHQVKAYLSKDKWNSYSKAMDKLLKHRAESNNPTAKCYLTVAKEIKDWDDASNTYNVSVELYKRASKVVGVCDVRNEIDTEILAYLKSKGYSDKAEEIVYGELCLFLDDSIARMHKQDSKKRKYIIKFSDIVGIMESAIDKEDVRKEYFLKEKIYEYVMQNIEKALNNLCQDECDTSLENCNRICAAKCGYEKMTEIVDYGQFCKLLNPGKVDEWDNELNLVETLSVDKIQSEIYELLYRSDTPEKVTLANDVNKDIVISAILSSDFSDEIHVERKLLCKNEFQSIITLNSQEISQEELYDKFHLSSNMFDIGTYISQSESLDFLQNKYKNRKDSVSSLLDDTEITDKIQMLKSVQEHILGRVEKEIGDKEKQIGVVSQRVNEIKRQTDHIVMNAELPGENIRLFDEVEYEFDVIKLDQGVTYETVIQQLKQIEGFIENYEEYLRYKDNAIIRELKASPKRLYMALFYRQEIELLNKKESLIKELNKSKELLMNYSNNVWSVDETLFNKIKIKAEIIAQIKTLLLNQKKEQSQLDDADKVLAQMTKARRGLIKEFYNAAESGKFDKNKCPLCGTDFTDIDSAIIETERFIKNIHTDGIKIIEDIETQITNLFQKEIIPVLKVFLEENKVLIKMDDTLSGCKNLAVEKLQQLLDKVKISEFKSQGIEKFDIEEFSQQYENLLKELQEKEVPNKIIFQEKQVELYKSIHNTYYHNEKPYHTVGELQSKEQYVAKLFNDNLSQQLSTEEARLRKLKRDYEEYKNKTKDMTDAIKVLVGKYEDANKEYQTQLLNAIKIPLMVYSGRIIQNYPLGLGIRAVIKTNQLVFEAASKSGSDVYNILSTGQLNGLSIALLLSIKNVYGDTKGLDILLIDDPLQTIDDISAISLADLLTQQGIGQIVLSTHEEAKAALLRYKFKHAGMSVREQNMQALYMKTVTEE